VEAPGDHENADRGDDDPEGVDRFAARRGEDGKAAGGDNGDQHPEDCGQGRGAGLHGWEILQSGVRKESGM